VIDGWFVVEGDGGDLFRQREDHVEVGHGQQLGRTLLQPVRAGQPLALVTVAVAAGAIDDTAVLAVVAPFDGAAHGGGTAVDDGLHQAMLMQGQGMRAPVGVAVLSKDVGQLRSRPGHGGPLGRGLGFGFGFAAEAFSGLHVIQRAGGGANHLGGDGGIAGRSVDALVAEQNLDDADIGAILQQMRGETVAQRVLVLLMICARRKSAIAITRAMA